MDDFVLPWEAAKRGPRAPSASSTSSASGAPKRRSSILKQKTFTASADSVGQQQSSRVALQDINGRSNNVNANSKEAAKRRRSLKRVSFSASKQVKEFVSGSETLTVWNNTYEEEQHSSSSSSLVQQQNSSSGSSDEEKIASSRKRSHPDGAHDGQDQGASPPKKFHPLSIDIPLVYPETGAAWEPHAFLPMSEEPHDLLKIAEVKSAPDATAFLSAIGGREQKTEDDRAFLQMLEEDNMAKTRMNTSLNRGTTSRREVLSTFSSNEEMEKSLFVPENDDDDNVSLVSMDITRQVEEMERTRQTRPVSSAMDETSRWDKTRFGGNQSGLMDLTRAAATTTSSDDSQDDSLFTACSKDLSHIMGAETTVEADSSGMMEMTKPLPSVINDANSAPSSSVDTLANVDAEEEMEITLKVPALNVQAGDKSVLMEMTQPLESIKAKITENNLNIVEKVEMEKDSENAEIVDESISMEMTKPVLSLKSVSDPVAMKVVANAEISVSSPIQTGEKDQSVYMEMTKPLASTLQRMAEQSTKHTDQHRSEDNPSVGDQETSAQFGNEFADMELTKPLRSISGGRAVDTALSMVGKELNGVGDSDRSVDMEMTKAVPPVENALAKPDSITFSAEGDDKEQDMEMTVAVGALRVKQALGGGNGADEMENDEAAETDRVAQEASTLEELKPSEKESEKSCTTVKHKVVLADQTLIASVQQREESPIKPAKPVATKSVDDLLKMVGRKQEENKMENSSGDDDESKECPPPVEEQLEPVEEQLEECEPSILVPTSPSFVEQTQERQRPSEDEASKEKDDSAEEEEEDTPTVSFSKPELTKSLSSAFKKSFLEKLQTSECLSPGPKHKRGDEDSPEKQVAAVQNGEAEQEAEAEDSAKINHDSSEESVVHEEESSTAAPPPMSPPKPVSVTAFEYLAKNSCRPNSGHGRWRIVEFNEWRAQFSFLHGGLLLNLSLGHPRPCEAAQIGEQPVSVRHWTVSSAELARHPRIPSSDAALTARLLVRQLSPARLHAWCPTTDCLGEALHRISLAVDEAAKFMLDLMRVGDTHAPFSVDGQKVTFGYVSFAPKLLFSTTVDYAKGMQDLHKTVEVSNWNLSYVSKVLV